MRQIISGFVMCSLLGLHAEVMAGEPGVQVGDRVRIKVPGLMLRMAPAVLQKEKVSMFVSESFLVGRVELLDGKSMTLWSERADSSIHVSMHDVTRMDVWSKGSYKAPGMFLGLLGGGIVGGMIGKSNEGTTAPGGSSIEDLGLDLVQGALLGAFIGAFTGWVVGSTMTRDQWSEVAVHELRAGVTTGVRGEVGLMCSVSF